MVPLRRNFGTSLEPIAGRTFAVVRQTSQNKQVVQRVVVGGQRLETLIGRHRRRESSAEEANIEMYLAGISVRRVEDITEALWGTRVSPSVSDLNKKIYGTIEAWRNRPIVGEHPYVYLDGIVLKRSWAGEVRNVSLLVAIGVNGEGIKDAKLKTASHTAFRT